MTLPPSPRGPHLLQTAGWVTRPGPYSRRLRGRFGDTFTLHVDRRAPWVVLSHPDDVRQVFTGDPNVFHAGEGNAILRPLLGARSVLLLDGPEHMRERKTLLPPFHGERMQTYGELIRGIAEAEVASWPTQTPIGVRPRMQALTLEIIMRAVFGTRDEQLRAQLSTLLDWMGDPLRLMLIVLAGPQLNERAMRRMRAPIDQLLTAEIAKRRAAPDVHERDDILSMLVSATDMDDATMRDELLTLLMAGHETTATALAWALERLARHPTAWERLKTGDEDYLDAVVKETLRLRPVVPAVLRLLKAPVTIAGHDLPAGVAVQPNILLMHTREDVYPDPFAFKPERFLDSPAGTYTWIPFGGGVRRCLGASFALFEMKAVLRALADAVETLEPIGSSERPQRRAVTLVPAKDAQVSVARRAAPVRRVPPVPTGR
ncbi:cytochrome P450 [Solirubrobacter ginsenosidimutans]|uniref:Cytochrome P450 n=1 Tax=Solirubrobacter ginsenosidimutans TaxID=490573 RepID=A0A9X3S105_9ACTN|nr:cytochrome P450 [Solirubrobacter ginsenosidimutans]MDA0162735.1 cytochrome P450 [Solirubrobacter ginsenosidimutans]